MQKPLLCLLFVSLFLTFDVFAGPPQSPLPTKYGRVQQLLVDPNNDNRGWIITPQGIRFSKEIREKKWTLVFNRRTFQRLTRVRARRGLTYERLYASPEASGTIYLEIHNRSKTRHLFLSRDFGQHWKYLGFREGAPSNTQTEGEDEAVDLSRLNASDTVGGQDSESHTPSSYASQGRPGSSSVPVFKAYFDLILHLRPGISPWTFDNYHSLLLLDIIPSSKLKFSFEVNPNPRYFQLDLELSENITLLAGRILIPFDNLNPHNRYGGYLNNSQTAQPGAPPFLPDIWADLGLGIKWDLVRSGTLDVTSWFYIVNGFQDNGTDPLNFTTSYPNFGALPLEDNNTDKGMGARLKATFFRTTSFGLSLYSNRYTPDAAQSKRITMIGIDGGLRLRTRTSLSAGYVFTNVDLVADPNGSASTQRAGLYVLARQHFGEHFYGDLQGGVLQSDSRVTDAGDQGILGFRIGYDAVLYNISFAYRHDLKDVPSKANRNYTAFRLTVML